MFVFNSLVRAGFLTFRIQCRILVFMLLELLVADWPWGPHGLTLATMKEYLWIGK